MAKFIVLSRDFIAGAAEDQFSIQEIEAADSDTAWEVIEEEIASQTTQDWLLNDAEFGVLKSMLNNYKRRES